MTVTYLSVLGIFSSSDLLCLQGFHSCDLPCLGCLPHWPPVKAWAPFPTGHQLRPVTGHNTLYFCRVFSCSLHVLYNSTSCLEILAVVFLPRFVTCSTPAATSQIPAWPLFPICLFRSNNTVVLVTHNKFPLLNYPGWAPCSLAPD